MSTEVKPLVRVTWDDAEDPSGASTWMEADDVSEFSEHTALVVSVGILQHRTAKYLTLAGDFIEDTNQFGRVTKIPTAQVTLIEFLEPKDGGAIIPNGEKEETK